MVKYTRDEVISSSLKYFKGDELAANVWTDKYCLKDSEGNYYERTPDDMHKRLSKEFARIEAKYPNSMSEQEIYELFKDFKFVVPQGGPMAGIGNDFVITSLSNCFVIGNEGQSDSYGGIMKIDQEQVQLMKRRGGVGHDLSHLRPRGMVANGAKLKGETGMTLYMERYSNSTREVAQDSRRGALMLSTSIKHPDTEAFIDKKMDTSKVTGANVSVKIDDNFMAAVNLKREYVQQFPVDSSNPMMTKTIDPVKLWNKIVYNAWKSAEPGILFWDTILRECPTSGYGESWKPVSTNPCGEIPLCPYDSCRLIAINLYSYIVNPFTVDAYFDWNLFKNHVAKAQRLMDDLIDLEIEKIDKIIDKIKADPESDEIKAVELNLWNKVRQKAVEGRRTGLGVTAEGDMLTALGLKYGTVEATTFATVVHRKLAVNAYKSSIDMAVERGAFPVWDGEKDQQSSFLNRICDVLDEEYQEKWGKTGRRNIALLTIAPTGTTSLMTQTTSGIEPVFMPFYKRRRKTEDPKLCVFKDEIGDMWEEFFVIHPKLKVWYEVNNIGNVGVDHISIEQLNEDELQEIFKASPYFGSTSNDIDYVEKVRMQSEIQKWVDHSISVTVNMPNSATEEMISDVYKKAWQFGCKGVTVYRDGCRSGVLVSSTPKNEDGIEYKSAPKRPKTLDVDIYVKTALKKNWMIVVGIFKGKPYEIFAFEQPSITDFPKDIEKGTLTKVAKRHYKLTANKAGKEYVIDNIINLMNDDEQYQTTSFSLELRHGIDPKFIVDDIDKSSFITSFRKVIGRTLKNYIKDGDTGGKCPNCSNQLRYESGCKTCPSCGYSQCG
jgi:ribonucleoside-diphosphate reductase alpha chain